MINPAKFFAIPPATPFLPALARHVLALEEPHRAIVLLPSQRNCRSLAQHLRKQSPGGALILPSIVALSEAAGLLEQNNLASPISGHLRILLLTRMIEEQGGYSHVQAMALAGSLAGLMDECERDGIALERLSTLQVEGFAEHWQRMLQQLQVVLALWPQELKRRCLQNPIAYRNEVLLQLNKTWQTNPPLVPVIAAGSTASTPATLALLETIARLPKGEVIISADTLQQNPPPTHPHYFLTRLARRLQAEPEPLLKTESPRSQWLDFAFAPATELHHWHATVLPHSEALNGVQFVTNTDEAAEARDIAVRIRRWLETSEREVMAITNSTLRAAMLTAELKHYGIKADSSLGKALRLVPSAGYLQLLAQASVMPRYETVLALLKHPLTKPTEDRRQWLSNVREVETQLRRGKTVSLPDFPRLSATLKTWPQWVEHHIEQAETLSSPEALWGKQSGEVVADVLRNMREMNIQRSYSLSEYAASFMQLIASETLRASEHLATRVRILTPQEARLESADVVVIMGMNEGEFPAKAKPSPWLSDTHKAALHFPPKEAALSRTAYDLYQLCHAPILVLSSTHAASGDVAMPSRFLQRMMLLGKAQTSPLKLERLAMPKPAFDTPCKPPMPSPPYEARPNTLSISDCEQLQRDAYAVYAKRVLDLKPLDSLEQETDARMFGNAMHKVLEYFVQLSGDADAAIKHGLKEYTNTPYYEVWKLRAMRVLQEIKSLGRSMRIEPEITFSHMFSHIELNTKIDRIEHLGGGECRIVDYKTGALPSLKDIESGVACQLPLMAWMLEACRGVRVSALEYWPVSGRETVTPKDVSASAADGLNILQRLIQQFYIDLAPFTPQKDGEAKHSTYAHLERIKEWG